MANQQNYQQQAHAKREVWNYVKDLYSKVSPINPDFVQERVIISSVDLKKNNTYRFSISENARQTCACGSDNLVAQNNSFFAYRMALKIAKVDTALKGAERWLTYPDPQTFDASNIDSLYALYNGKIVIKIGTQTMTRGILCQNFLDIPITQNNVPAGAVNSQNFMSGTMELLPWIEFSSLTASEVTLEINNTNFSLNFEDPKYTLIATLFLTGYEVEGGATVLAN